MIGANGRSKWVKRQLVQNSSDLELNLNEAYLANQKAWTKEQCNPQHNAWFSEEERLGQRMNELRGEYKEKFPEKNHTINHQPRKSGTAKTQQRIHMHMIIAQSRGLGVRSTEPASRGFTPCK